jgi:hypothetical protein
VEVRTPWLGRKRGYLSDWVTQRWVQATGRRIPLASHPWLDGPVGDPREIGADFFRGYAERHGLLSAADEATAGLVRDFAELGGPDFDAGSVHPLVRRFYEQTSLFELDLWSEWCGAFRPFGFALAVLFSRRLRQLNLPLTPLDSSRGMASSVVPMRAAPGAAPLFTAWVRSNRLDSQVVYVAAYSVVRVPGWGSPCVKVVFPLPNGSATVLLRPSVSAGGALLLSSSGARFGDPGFYFLVRASEDSAWVRHLRTFRESIRVFVDDRGRLRADHVFTLWQLVFLRLHYSLREEAGGRRD